MNEPRVCLDCGKRGIFVMEKGLCVDCYLRFSRWKLYFSDVDIEWMENLDKLLDISSLTEAAWKIANFDLLPIDLNGKQI